MHRELVLEVTEVVELDAGLEAKRAAEIVGSRRGVAKDGALRPEIARRENVADLAQSVPSTDQREGSRAKLGLGIEPVLDREVRESPVGRGTVLEALDRVVAEAHLGSSAHVLGAQHDAP